MNTDDPRGNGAVVPPRVPSHPGRPARDRDWIEPVVAQSAADAALLRREPT